MKYVPCLLFALCLAGCNASDPQQASETSTENLASGSALTQLIASAKRIPSRSGWFEILKLPNNVYGIWEPGHIEKVNSFYITGDTKDVLYDTGMGIASIADAVQDIRQFENLPDKPLMVINSHNHLDHNGGNIDFPAIWTVNHPWAIHRLVSGVPAGEAGGFTPYWDQLTEHEGVTPPESFDPYQFSISPYPLSQINFLDDGDIVDLGNRQFQVIRTYSHSPDGLALYSKQEKMFFGGDAFYGAHYLSRSLELLAQDLENTKDLPVAWHYASHGPQLITAMQHGFHLTVIRKMLDGQGNETTTEFAGLPLPVRELDGVQVTIAGEILLY